MGLDLGRVRRSWDEYMKIQCMEFLRINKINPNGIRKSNDSDAD